MSIFPLPQFEADLEEYRAKKEAEQSATPETIVVRFGRMRQIGEYRYTGDIRPGCGSKMVVTTHRGAEVAELLTSTCPNAGCGKSVTRKEMLEYIENSGGKDFPFYTGGESVRLATREDLQKQNELDRTIPDLVRSTRQLVKELGLPMKIVDADPILGGERLTFYFMADERVDFRELARRLGEIHKTRIDLRQIGARDEARLTADYERCGQHCCCKQFLKVLKPVSIKSAKQQKATLDPLKISGRCGRLMCCLRYEDQTYKELKKRLPNRKSRVGTPDGPGRVIDSQILTQIVLVELEQGGGRVALPVEELTDPDAAPPPDKAPPAPTAKPDAPERRKNKTAGEGDDAARTRRRRPPKGPAPKGPAPKGGGDAAKPERGASPGAGEPRKKRRRRRGRRGRGRGGDDVGGGGGDGG